MKEWKNGRVERQRNLTIRQFDNSTMEEWKDGRMEEWKNGRIRQFDNSTIGKMENWKNSKLKYYNFEKLRLFFALCSMRFALCKKTAT